MPLHSLAEIMKRLDAVVMLNFTYDAGVVSGIRLVQEMKEPGSSKTHRIGGPWSMPPEDYAKLGEQCRDLGLIASYMSVDRLTEFVKKTGKKRPTIETLDELQDELRGRLADELEARMLLFVEPDKVQFYEKPTLFGPAVEAKFGPDVALDVEEAGKCLALDRGTACVFHLMRVLEVGLQALEAKLGIARTKDANWHIILQDINNAIKAMPFATQAEKDYRAPFAAAAAHLENVKNAWRNDVMHPRESYTPEQALDVWNHSKALMAKLAEFL
jgi:hypothetical protein